MRLVGVMLVAGLLAACSKQEPSAAVKPRDEPHRHVSPKPGEGGSAQSEGGGATQAVPASASPELLAQGEKLFGENCATCHMADGGGVPFLQPPIKGSAWISNPDPQLLLSLILRGSAVLGEAAQAFENDMAPQGHLTDVEIAALANYARQRFSAMPPAKPVTPAEVAIARSRPGLP